MAASILIGPQTVVSGKLDVPGSKSLTNRALVLAALADGASELSGALVAEDSEVMVESLRRLGFGVEQQGMTVRVQGGAGSVPQASAELDLRLSGTSIRFLTALVALGRGRYRLDGNHRMRERPIHHLLSALNGLGANAVSELGNGCPPVLVEARGLAGGETTVAGDLSSQFLSALLMVAPCAAGPVAINVSGTLQSQPFVDMTLDLMRSFEVEVRRDGYRRFELAPGSYRARRLQIEGDAMAAGYFWAAAAVTGGRVRITNLGSATRQGDARLAEVLGEMGCSVSWGEQWCELAGPAGGRLKSGDFDLNDMPDQAQTLAVVALFADGPVRIRNVANLRIKETDRLAAMAAELGRLGARVEEGEDQLVVYPLEVLPGKRVSLRTYGDHRMAMALAVAGARLEQIEILDPGCVSKTYPGFFDDFGALLSGHLA